MFLLNSVLTLPIGFSFTEDNGSYRQESGTQEFDGQNDVNVIRGSYSYVSPEGELIEVSFTF